MRFPFPLLIVLFVLIASIATFAPQLSVAAGPRNDHYQILGVARDADDAAIKKAYRKLAKKYHPDRHTDPEKKKKAEQLFIKVAKAYETLSDPEKRRIYDQVGDEGVQQHEQGGGGGGPGGNPFGGGGGFQFHSGGGGGGDFDPFRIFEAMFGTRGFPRGGGGRRQQQQPQQAFFTAREVLDLTSTQVAKKYIGKEQRQRGRRVWLVMFFAPWCGHCQNTKPQFERFAKEAKGIVLAGAVNCDENQQLCQHYKIQGFPTILALSPDPATPPQPAQQRDAKGLFEFAVSQIPRTKALKIVKSKADAPKACTKTVCVVLTSSKPSPSPLYRSLAYRFEEHADFIFVRNSEEKGVLEVDGKPYHGENTMEALYKHLASVIKAKRRAGGGKKNNKEEL